MPDKIDIKYYQKTSIHSQFSLIINIIFKHSPNRLIHNV